MPDEDARPAPRAPSTTRVLWRRPLKLIGNAWLLLPIGLALSSCLVGLPIAARAMKILTRLVADNARALRGQRPLDDPERSYAGSIALAGLLLLGGSAPTGAVLALHLGVALAEAAQVGLGLAVGFATPVVVGAALASLLFAPVAAVGGVDGPFAPFARSFELAASRGAHASLLTGAGVGAIFGAAFALLGGVAYAVTDQPAAAVLWAPLAALFAAPRALALLANLWASVEAEVPAYAGPSDARLRALGWLVAPALLVVLGAFVAAAAVPRPMQSSPAGAAARGITPEMLDRGLVREGRLPGTDVRVRVLERGIAIEADDGGGAGAIDAGFDTLAGVVYVDRRTRDGRPIDEYRVLVTNGERAAYTVVDARGVRLDDSLTRRTFGRLGQLGSIGLALGALLLLFLTFTVGAELGEAQTLAAPAFLGGERTAGGLAALEGTLRLGEDAHVVLTPPSAWARLVGRDGATLRARGEVWLEADGGAIRVRLPEGPVPVIGAGSAEDWDHLGVVLVSRFAARVVVGPRQGSAPWPADGRLVLGASDDARAALVRGAVRRASRIALPMLAGFFTAAAALLLSL
ncbi:MAG: hypothetical protein KF729_03595 [Sandaracinaceae bacterium]|nr:hypothetical protein [Sandaracinaceae bacterium]